MKLIIAKVDDVLYDGEARSVTVPAQDGEMTVFGDHMPLITTLKAGVIVVHETSTSQEIKFEIQKGVLEVRRDGATVIL